MSDRHDSTEQDVQTLEASNGSWNNWKLCWVCLEIDKGDDPDSIWICPCRCKGTMKWVHEECLQIWIDEKQKLTNSHGVACSQCKTTYICSYPPANVVLKLLDVYDKFLYSSSAIVFGAIIGGSVLWCCWSYGLVSVIQVMGYEDGLNFIEHFELPVLILILPAIPISLLLAKAIRWEEYLLRSWLSGSLHIPKPLSFIFDEPPKRVRPGSDRILEEPPFTEPLYCTRTISGALLLPTISALVGKFLFSSYTSSQWRRSLLGGAAFLLIKGALKIYCRKSYFLRYTKRRIRDFDPTQTQAMRPASANTRIFSATITLQRSPSLSSLPSMAAEGPVAPD